MEEEKVLQKFVEAVKKRYSGKIERIFLFGSYARGEYGEESDIDVLIIGDVPLDGLVEISFPLLLKYGVYISPHVMTGEHFSLLEREGYGFIKNVKKEGRVIYG
ncbi:MAG: nucleotidyltransferase domain-containing protein [Candidatus Freyarchaeota archaeon]|nr:nucleotidyltransferase domain-containing protein [Candidatus Jordarchaeia archaeon]MBS7267853.1 nucleotidyltransferase domain-containing protein [Candidatus Jordarchaeia archaeon]MBS7280946.1 nucleotidyltransferase domain-containing protein [Candidatus Jordarchaeia archaeon]